MQLLIILGAIYLFIGFLYALYILLFAGDEWYWFPVNMIGGPVALLYIIYKTFQGKRLPIIR